MINHVVLILFVLKFCLSTTDINIHQLQMVADHLEPAECRQLVEALHEHKTFLEKQPTGEAEPNKPCIFLLLRWDRTEGHGKTFNDLALRLSQIGRGDLANKLSKSIYNEESDELKRTFLGQPFKKNIPKNSFLLAQDEDDEPEVKLKQADDIPPGGLSGWEIAGIVAGILAGLFIVCFLVYFFFGSLIAKMFNQYAPDFMVKWLDLVSGEVKWLWKKLKRDYSKHVVGSKAGSGMSRPSRRLTMEQMNRNLNNYLNGHIPENDRDYYFRKFANQSH